MDGHCHCSVQTTEWNNIESLPDVTSLFPRTKSDIHSDSAWYIHSGLTQLLGKQGVNYGDFEPPAPISTPLAAS